MCHCSEEISPFITHLKAFLLFSRRVAFNDPQILDINIFNEKTFFHLLHNHLLTRFSLSLHYFHLILILM